MQSRNTVQLLIDNKYIDKTEKNIINEIDKFIYF